MNYITKKSPLERAFWVGLIMGCIYVLAQLYFFEPLQDEYDEKENRFKRQGVAPRVLSRSMVFKRTLGKLKELSGLKIINISNAKGAITLYSIGDFKSALEQILLLEQEAQIYISRIEIEQKDGAFKSKLTFRILDLQSLIYKKRDIARIVLVDTPKIKLEPKEKAMQEGEKSQEPLELEAIINKDAKISGRWVSVGDRIGGHYRVGEVMTNSVILESKKNKLKLELR